MSKGNTLRHWMAVVREFLKDRLVNLVGKHGWLAIAWVRDDLDRLLFVDFRVSKALLDAFHGVEKHICCLRIKCKVVTFKVKKINLVKEPLRSRYVLFLLFYESKCLRFSPHRVRCRTFDVFIM